MFIHDGLVHKRFPVGPIADVPYLKRVAIAHKLHHSEKYNGVPWGLFLGPHVRSQPLLHLSTSCIIFVIKAQLAVGLKCIAHEVYYLRIHYGASLGTVLSYQVRAGFMHSSELLHTSRVICCSFSKEI